MVRDTGFEPVTPTVSRRNAPWDIFALPSITTPYSSMHTHATLKSATGSKVSFSHGFARRSDGNALPCCRQHYIGCVTRFLFMELKQYLANPKKIDAGSAVLGTIWIDLVDQLTSVTK